MNATSRTSPWRLLLTAGLLASQVACLDLEHRVNVHHSGAIDYVLRLGLESKYATGPLAKPADERERDWKAHVPAASAQYVDAHVEQTPETVWLVIDGSLPDVAAYDVFRDGFIKLYEADHKPNALFYPPVIEQRLTGYVVRADVRPSEEPVVIPEGAKLGTNTWRLIVTGEAEVAPSMGAIASDGGRTVTFERPLLEVAKEGTYAEVSVPGTVNATLYVVLGGVLLLGLGAGVAAVVARRVA